VRSREDVGQRPRQLRDVLLLARARPGTTSGPARGGRSRPQLDSLEIPLAAVRSLGWRRIIRRGQPLSTTVELETTDGHVEIFVIPDAERLAERLEEGRVLRSEG